MKKIVLLGATGSIGMQTIDVCLKHPDKFEIVGLSVGRNINLLQKILTKLTVKSVCIKEYNQFLIDKYPDIDFYFGDTGLIDLVSLSDYQVLVNALVGFVGLMPTITAIKNKKNVALANKETLVVAGDIVNKLKNKYGVTIYPIDSEHSAIFQALQGNKINQVKKIIITASGGSFRNLSREDLKNVTVNDALNHPNWKMGAKITIDSATMMNKGFEVIEAHYLFDLPYNKIETILHYESIVHSMVEYNDNSIIAQLGNSDMRLPIQYAITYPDRYNVIGSEELDFKKWSNLTFKEMDYDRYPLLKFAYEVGVKSGKLYQKL